MINNFMNYYVYVWITPIEINIKNTTILKGSPFYVGKGSGNRATKHLQESYTDRYNELKSAVVDRIKLLDHEPIVDIYEMFDTEEESFKCEKNLIEEYGRIVDREGTLTNLTYGGEGASGFQHSESTKKKWSEMRKGISPYNKGMKRPGIGGRKKGTVWSDDERKTKEEIFRNRDNSSFRTEEFRTATSTRWKEGFASGKITHAASGKKWYNNGIEQTYFVEGHQPPGWQSGRLKMKTNNKTGLRWFNNGIFNKQYRIGEEPEGFVRGRVSKK